MNHSLDRRRFVLGMLATPLAMHTAGAAPSPAPAPDVAPPATLPPWSPGYLDIHHIATGRGNATFILMPDGTSMLIDAGATDDTLNVSAAPKPDGTRRPGVWIGRYIQRHLRATGREQLDYLLVTHIHPDHLGDVSDASPLSAQGPYRLTGITDVAEMLPVGLLIDRAYPSYDFPAAPKGRFAENYLAFVKSRVQRGLAVERIRVGGTSQLAMRGGTAPFSIRTIAANGEVWTGKGGQTKNMFPSLNTLAAADYPNENVCSIALKFSLGKFSYFTAGDLTSYTYDGDLPWRDVLGAAARVAGPASVATADHHGMFDGLSADVVRALRPQAWVIPTWHIAHPDMLQLERMLSERLYPGPREIYATSLMTANHLANQRLTSKMRSRDGHIVVRVAPDGEAFTIYVTDNGDENDTIRSISKHDA
ncbi:ComEC/Rec2 family competence protein [Duganella callida]|uniref:MBL fold metallo-hydrolase n=1 Tax=Duganella callida TaxID=2561932 RepID=A0A4Y9T0V8_9BURK|nr:MBL fold metallo-hydrolase [Duganella callida]TFW31483.1 MBL fold metallo-hydrolase [Duganella callida]